jgi:hypothetical protein
LKRDQKFQIPKDENIDIFSQNEGFTAKNHEQLAGVRWLGIFANLLTKIANESMNSVSSDSF